MNNISNIQIKHNFNKIAPIYLSNTNIQKITALELETRINKLDINISPKDIILDIGSGPGTLLHTSLSNSPILFDLSLAMLKLKNTKSFAINGNATHLPFADNSFDYIISNLMLQWVHDKNMVFAEIARTLKTNGKLMITILTKPSLWQIENVWQQIDNYPHILQFEEHSIINRMCKNNQLQIIDHIQKEHTMYFDSYLEIMRHFKATGTTIPKPNNTGLYGKQIIKKIENLYINRFGDKNETTMNTIPITRLPISYYYSLLVATKL